MSEQDIFKALVDVIDIVVEHNTGPLVLGDIKFEILRTGKVRPSHPVHKWTTADCINILGDLRLYLEMDYDLGDK